MCFVLPGTHRKSDASLKDVDAAAHCCWWERWRRSGLSHESLSLVYQHRPDKPSCVWMCLRLFSHWLRLFAPKPSWILPQVLFECLCCIDVPQTFCFGFVLISSVSGVRSALCFSTLCFLRKSWAQFFPCLHGFLIETGCLDRVPLLASDWQLVLGAGRSHSRERLIGQKSVWFSFGLVWFP